jgi:hypothetical protein
MILVKDKALPLEVTVERFHQDLVNVGLHLRRLVRQEKILTQAIPLVTPEII